MKSSPFQTPDPARRSLCLSAVSALSALSLAPAQAWSNPAGPSSTLPSPVPAPASAPAHAPIFVLNSLDANVSVIDPVSLQVTQTIPTGKEPHHLYMTPDDQSVLVANAAGDSITFIDPRTAKVQREVTGISDPYHLRFSPDMKWFVTVANRLNHVDIYHWEPKNEKNPFRLAKRIPTGKTPSHMWIDSRSRTVFATMQDSHEVIAVDLESQSVRWRVGTGKLPADVYLTADDNLLLVALTGDKYVEVYDVSNGPAKLVKRIETGASAHAFRAMGDKRHVFLGNREADTISLIDTQTQTVVDKLPGPGGPDCMELLADRKTLLVSSRWIRKLTFVDVPSRKVRHQVKVGKSPHGVFTLNHAPRQ